MEVRPQLRRKLRPWGAEILGVGWREQRGMPHANFLLKPRIIMNSLIFPFHYFFLKFSIFHVFYVIFDTCFAKHKSEKPLVSLKEKYRAHMKN